MRSSMERRLLNTDSKPNSIDSNASYKRSTSMDFLERPVVRSSYLLAKRPVSMAHYSTDLVDRSNQRRQMLNTVRSYPLTLSLYL